MYSSFRNQCFKFAQSRLVILINC